MTIAKEFNCPKILFSYYWFLIGVVKYLEPFETFVGPNALISNSTHHTIELTPQNMFQKPSAISGKIKLNRPTNNSPSRNVSYSLF